MMNRLLTVTIANLVALGSYFASVADALPSSPTSVKQENSSIQDHPPIPQIGDIERDPDGGIKYMMRLDAVKYCASKGQHLPSARELAQFATTMGARISETAEDGYDKVTATNLDGSVDSFYYRWIEYNSRPAGGFRTNTFWSSSVYKDDQDRTYYFSFYGGWGSISYNYYRDDRTQVESYNAVLCANGQ